MNDHKPHAPETDIVISTDLARFELDRIHQWLTTEAYWCKGLPRDTFDRSIAHSTCFGAFAPSGEQSGFARVVADHATFAYLSDVFVFPQYRGRGISKALMEAVMAHPCTQGVRRFMLATSDAFGLYAQYGFTSLGEPGRFMEKVRPRAYQQETQIA
jgi:GNAT superfamily N-acetyltransferase